MLFADTDDDMWMMAEGVHPCGNCGVYFLSQENLKNHEERCMSTRETHRNLHQRHCRRAGEIVRSAKQRKIDEFASQSVVQTGGSNVDVTLPKLIESALNKKAMTYRKDFEMANQNDPYDKLTNALPMFKPIIQNELENKPAVKYFFTLKMVFHQSKDTSILTDVPVSFRSEVFSALDDSKLELHNRVAIKQLHQQIDQFQRNGSGWILDHFINVDIGKNELVI